MDIAGYNYAAFRYEQDGQLYPNRIIAGSETFPQDLDVNWELVEKNPYVIGDFPGRPGTTWEKRGSERFPTGKARAWAFMPIIPVRPHIAEI